MKQILNYFIPISFIVLLILIQSACVHDAIMGVDLDPDPMDTSTNPTDTMLGDTMPTDTMNNDTMGNAIPCDPDLVYFTRDILPILNSNCALSGCHDVITAEKGIVLSSYESILASDVIEPFDLSESELYEAITEDDEDDIMPPTGKLPTEQIVLIAKWILQGADTLNCDSNDSNCSIEEITYSNYITNELSTHCYGCHSSNVASGGVILDSYSTLKSLVDSGRFYGAINWDPGFKQMPQNMDQLDSCTLVNIKKWIDGGALNN